MSLIAAMAGLSEVERERRVAFGNVKQQEAEAVAALEGLSRDLLRVWSLSGPYQTAEVASVVRAIAVAVEGLDRVRARLEPTVPAQAELGFGGVR